MTGAGSAARFPIYRLLTTAGLMALLFVLSTIPGTERPGDSSFVWVVEFTPRPLQKAMHVVCYATLTILWFWTLTGLRDRRKRSLVALLAAVLFGAAMEWFQIGVPGRYASLSDILLNTAGAAVGLACVAVWQVLRKRRLARGLP